MRVRAVVLAVAVLVAAKPGAAADPPPVSFARQIQPIFNVTCVECHIHGPAIGFLDLGPEAAYAELVGVWSTQADMPRVDPGSVATSYLVHKLQGTHVDVGGTGMRMPMGGAQLSERQLDLIRRWIAEGAHAE